MIDGMMAVASLSQSKLMPQTAQNLDMGPRPRDEWGHMIFHSFTRPGDKQIQASDALLIAELAESNYQLSSTGDDLPRLSPDSPRRIEKLAISTPNADYLPLLNLGPQVVAMCMDGRWGAEDWGQWPQWYFIGQDHYAYILRKPDTPALPNHPLRRCWWNVCETDFRRDQGLEFGLLSPDIAAEFHTIQENLMNEVKSCACPNGADYQKLAECSAKMRHCISTLRFTPLPFNSVTLTVASAQRYCLETRAMLDKIAMSKNLPFQTTYSPADNTRLGCVTDRITLVHEMYERGIPVWYVRPSSQVPLNTNIVQQAPVIRPSRAGIQTKRWPNAPIFYQGPISREMHAGIESWKPGNLQLHLLGRSSVVPDSGTLTLTNDHNLTQNHATPNSTRKRVEPYSKAKAAARVAEKKPITTAINFDLFKVVDLPYQTHPLGSWKKALADVKAHPHRIIEHPDTALFRGYAFPPPHLFCSADNRRNEEYMLSWLVIRSVWMGNLGESSDTPLPNPQQWRSYLRGIALDLELLRTDERRMPVLPPPSSSTRGVTSHSARRRAKDKEALKNIFKIYVPSQKALHWIPWNNHIVWSHNQLNLRPLDRELIVWDVEEHNFRVELTTLDHLVMATMWGEREGRVVRDRKLNALWPQGVVLSLQVPDGSTCGIATKDWVKRCPYVEAFRDIIMDWPGHIPEMLKRLSIRREEAQVGVETVWDESAMEKVESLAALHYCQTFFDYFGRAPSVPRKFPSL